MEKKINTHKTSALRDKGNLTRMGYLYKGKYIGKRTSPLTYSISLRKMVARKAPSSSYNGVKDYRRQTEQILLKIYVLEKVSENPTDIGKNPQLWPVGC